MVSLTPDTPDEDTDAFFPDFAPVPLLRRRRAGWTPDRQRLFIALLAETGSVKLSARCVGLSARSAYQLRLKPGADAFDAVWEEALEIGEQRVRDRLLERWRYGETVAVHRRGRVVGYRQKSNDNALIAVLTSGRREAARQRSAREQEDRAWRRDSAAIWREVARAEAATRRASAADLHESHIRHAKDLADKAAPHPPQIREL